MLKVYVAHQISGLTCADVMNWFDMAKDALYTYGFEVMSPMTGKEEFHNNMEERAIPYKPEGYTDNPIRANHAIYERDKWMVSNCDIVFTDFTGTTSISIGCTMELAWASYVGRHTVVVLPKDNVHRHAFVLESADIIFETYEEAMTYMWKIGGCLE